MHGDEAEGLLTVAGLTSLADGQSVFRLGSSGAFVIAGVMMSLEDDLSYRNPSGLPCWPMRSGLG